MSVLKTALVIAAIGAATATQQAYAGEEPTHDVPHWMTKVCVQEDDVNCWWDGGSIKPHQGKAFIRQMPNSNLVCVMFVNTPRRDYCDRRR